VTILAPTASTGILAAAVIAEDRSVVMHNRSRMLVIAGLVPLLVTLLGLSTVGGVGGHTGPSMWWVAICVSYPVGGRSALSPL
jgi:hypothetical protein